MGYKVELEYKFLVDAAKLPELKGGSKLSQGYLAFNPTVRIRLDEPENGQAVGYITIKSPALAGRNEFEYEIPADEAKELLKLAQSSVVAKRRYKLPLEGAPDLKWELDVFEGDNAGLMIAELEVPDSTTNFTRPAWIGEDVTDDPRYTNAALSSHPYKFW
jgi:CYTH domain-containing protein